MRDKRARLSDRRKGELFGWTKGELFGCAIDGKWAVPMSARGDFEQRQFGGCKQPDVLQCHIGSLSPGKGRQVGEQGKGARGATESTPDVDATDALPVIRLVTLMNQCTDAIVIFAKNGPVIEGHGSLKFLSKVN